MARSAARSADRIGLVGGAVAPEHVPGKLVEKEDDREGAFGRQFPLVEIAPGGGLIGGQESGPGRPGRRRRPSRTISTDRHRARRRDFIGGGQSVASMFLGCAESEGTAISGVPAARFHRRAQTVSAVGWPSPAVRARVRGHFRTNDRLPAQLCSLKRRWKTRMLRISAGESAAQIEDRGRIPLERT